MGGACCVAARDRNIVSGPGSDILHRNIRHSPTWSFRWDNRRRVAGEDASISWFSNETSRNDGSDAKYESTYASEDGSPSTSARRHTFQKSPLSDRALGPLTTPASDQSISRNASMDTNVEQVKETEGPPATSNHYTSNLSLSLPSTSSLSNSPMSTAQSHLLPASSTKATWSPGQEASGSKNPELKTGSEDNRFTNPSWSNESTRGSHGGSSDSWSMLAFSELMATSNRERWSFDTTESLGGSNRGKTRGHGHQKSASSFSMDLQTCGICLKLLTEKSVWSTRKLIASNELSVVAVLTCGHAYHAECLETLTPEITKYDPSCPICTLGEKQTLKLCRRAMKAEMDLKAAKNKKSRSRVVDSDPDEDSLNGDHVKFPGREERKGPKLGSSSSMKTSTSKPFLKRHFSFGSKGARYTSENHHSTKKKGFFWTRSLKG
ncbi:unnamed protein product [Linum tenue]|uniref:RING-type domain-containing protein n=1 Tax=Linum tenue TaxID=586396 RepID=A0AAV0LV01_9ROSI|nr:unnamed protein product [Linum tenue]